MTTTKPLGVGQLMLWMSPVVLAVVAFFGLLRWFKPHNATFVLVLAAVFAIFVMGYTTVITRRVQRTLDEVQIASQGFASFRGYVWGAGVMALLLMLPPVTNWLIDMADGLTAGAPDPIARHRAGMQVELYFGFALTVLLQAACIAVAAAIWQRRMRSPEE